MTATSATPTPTPPSGDPRLRRLMPWLAFVIAALPLIVAAVAIAVRRPVIDWTGDRALTELGVRLAAHGHQQLGIGGRFGWRHPGPLWMQLLVPGYELTGHAPWSLSVGVLAIHVAMIGLAVVGAVRAAGPRGAALVAAAIAVYLRATGLLYWTNMWAGYAFTWPMLALVVLAALAMSDPRAGWAVVAALLVGTLMVQTDVSTAVPVAVIGGVAFGVRMVRVGVGRFLAATPTGDPAADSGPRRWSGPVSSGAAALLVLVVAAWIPPVVQQVTTQPGNMTLLVRFARQGAGGYSLRTAAAAVGAALSVFPVGARWVLRPGVQARLDPGPWWAVAVTAATVVASLAIAVVAWRRQRRFAGDLALISALAVIAAVVAMSRVDGPLNFYLLTWITILPVPAAVAAVLALAPSASGVDVVTVVAMVAAVAIGVGVTAVHGTEHDWDRQASADVAAETAMAVRALGPAARALVRVHVVTSDTWPDAAGVAVQLQHAGGRIEVDANWVFLFGDAFKPGAASPSGELWFARPHEAPVMAGVPGAQLVGTVAGVDVYARA